MSALLAYLALANLAAFAAMGWDKSSARRGVARIPERTLLTLAAAGGGLGAVLAQQAFRHKTRKQPFAALLYAIFSAEAVLAFVLLRQA
ncbi:DUF1294 domain-containing protein [Phenylobacterium sp.]|uniref:DUF1294 domain-containing protein n=1 Tax=Phenylobacterium sp. TaxID=1871053 RepID=UPI0028A07053|nr:DUF1294 domain-containing protein [Phenylobacterium sp.]